MAEGARTSEGEGELVAGRYRLESRIGSGAMGVVWRATDIRLDRPVAVKQLLLPPGLAGTETEKARQRAFREGRIAARLQHPHAISVYNVADHEGHPVLVMEYLPSRSLAAVLDERTTLPAEEAARIGAQVAAALTAAHAAGVVHRDVKPGNILLGEDGTAKITDFGISRAAGDITVTSTGLLAGTPAFLSPETARGAEPGAAADVFSLGATLYAAVEGRPPFEEADNEIALLHTVASGNVLPPRQAGCLTPALQAMLSPEADARPTMAHVERSLRAAAEGRPAPEIEAPTLPATPRREPARAEPHPGPPHPARPHPPTRQQPQHPHPAPLSHPVRAQQPTRAQSPVRPSPPPAPTGGPRPRPGGPEPATPSARHSRTRIAVVTFAVLAAAAVGVLVAEWLVGASEQPGEAPSARDSALTAPGTPAPPAGETGATASAPGTTARTTATTAEPTQSSPPHSTPSSARPGPAAMEQAVARYYALLPGDIDTAWQGLGPALRKDGKDAYTRFWSGVEAVEVVRGPDTVGKNVVEVELDFTMPGGGVVREVHRLGMVVRDGRALINSDERLSSTTLGPGS